MEAPGTSSSDKPQRYAVKPHASLGEERAVVREDFVDGALLNRNPFVRITATSLQRESHLVKWGPQS